MITSCSHHNTKSSRIIASLREKRSCTDYLFSILEYPKKVFDFSKIPLLKRPEIPFSSKNFSDAYNFYTLNIHDYKDFPLPRTVEERLAYFEAIQNSFFKNGLGESLVKKTYNEDKIKRILSTKHFDSGMSERKLKKIISQIYNIKYKNVFSFRRLFLNSSTLEEDALYYYFSKEVLEHGLLQGLTNSGLLKNNFRSQFATFFSSGFGKYFLLALYNLPFFQNGAIIPIFVKTKNSKIFSTHFLENQLGKSFDKTHIDIKKYYGKKGKYLVRKEYFMKTYTYLAGISYLLFMSDSTSFSARKERKENEDDSAKQMEAITLELEAQLEQLEESKLLKVEDQDISCLIFKEALNQYYQEHDIVLDNEEKEYLELKESLGIQERTCFP